MAKPKKELTAAEAKRKKQNRTVFLILGLAALVVLIVGAMTVPRVLEQARQAQEKQGDDTYKVERGQVAVTVVETGPLEAVETVEVKSRVSGRVARLLVDEGDRVEEGDLIAVIDPEETELQAQQNRAQIRGARAGVQQTQIQIDQRRVTAQTAVRKAEMRLAQVEKELAVQPTLTNSAITSASSALASAEQSLDQLNRVTHPNRRTQTEREVRDAQANFRNAEIEIKRQERLLDRGYISRREYENAELQFKLAEQREEAAEAQLSRLDQELRLEREQAEERVKQARADLQRARANSVQDDAKREEYRRAQQDLRDARAALKDVDSLMAGKRSQEATVDQLQSALADTMRQLNETEIRAPVSGIVTNRLVQLGELVASLSSFSSGTPIIRLEDRSGMQVQLEVNEIDVAKLELGTDAEIKIDAFPEETFRGRVTKIAPASTAVGAQGGQGFGSDPVVKYEVEVRLDSSPTYLKSGMSATCTMTPIERENALRIRAEYLGTEDDGSPYVLVLEEEAKKPGEEPKTRKEPVRIGERGGAYVEILSGVEEGTPLVKPDFDGPSRSGFFGGGGGGDGDEDGDEESDGEEDGDSVEVTVD